MPKQAVFGSHPDITFAVLEERGYREVGKAVLLDILAKRDLLRGRQVRNQQQEDPTQQTRS
jgi:hypothetical protein